MWFDGAGNEAEGARAGDKAKGVGASDDKAPSALVGRLMTVDDAGIGDKTDRTASMELMSEMRLSACWRCMRRMMPMLAKRPTIQHQWSWCLR